MSPWWEMSIYTWSYSNCSLHAVSQLGILNILVIYCCYRFLNGRCKNTSCPYSHELTPGKVPTCSYFIKGACGQDNCPYAHSYVGHDAQICDDFVQGFCARGTEVCIKRNILFFFVFSYNIYINLNINSVLKTTCAVVSGLWINGPMSSW